ncbi:MAG TPA: hypothetical protein PKH94_00310 [Bacteroidales bacterium]|nr:hypothetical protein [Bacteroidales bacterium]HNS45658.1 hypothetical protein [Bacteroidales bacterium]
MIPIEVSYLRTIFSKSGQGRYFAKLPANCRELLAYLSIHFFMDRLTDVIITTRRPALISAGNTISWDLRNDPAVDINPDLSEDISINTLNNLYSKLSVSKIIRNIFLSYYAGEIEISEQGPAGPSGEANQFNHLQLSDAPTLDLTRDCWLYDGPETGAEKSEGETCVIEDAVSQCIPVPTKRSGGFQNLKKHLQFHKMNRWIYFLFHPYYDRISPPGFVYYYDVNFPCLKQDPGIRAGPS